MLRHLVLLVIVCILSWMKSISAAAPAPLTQAQKLAWLNDHNVVRCQANAQTMPALIWDDALEKTAQEYANTCPSGHNANRESRFVYFSGLSSSSVQGVGENYAAGYQTALDADAGWASEKPQMGGHYTQMVWADTTRVGCALNTVSCGGYGTYWLCDYYPPGNYIGEQPFVAGGSSNTEACQQQSRTDFPVMVYNNGVGTVVNGINGIPGAPTIGPSTPPTQAPTQAPTQPPTQPPTTLPTTRPTSVIPTSSPTSGPTSNPSSAPTSNPTSGPTNSGGGLFDPTTPPPLSDPANQSGVGSNVGSSSGSGNNMGMIIGIVVGVVVGIILLALVSYYLYHRRSSLSWGSTKTHMQDINADPNRYQRNNPLSPEPTGTPAPLTSISTTTPTYNPGQVFNPPSFVGGHHKQNSMDNYQSNPALTQGTSTMKPSIPSTPPSIPTSSPAVPTSRPVVPSSRPQTATPPLPHSPPQATIAPIPVSRPQVAVPPVPTSRPQMSPTTMSRQIGGQTAW